jgi:putative molybdopterin biosynthesis protein
MNMAEEKYYTIDEIAKILKVAYLTVYRWIQSGKLVAFKAGKQYRVKKGDLDRFITSYERKK